MHIVLYNFQHNTFYVVWETLLSIAVELKQISETHYLYLETQIWDVLNYWIVYYRLFQYQTLTYINWHQGEALLTSETHTKKNKEFGLSPHCGAPWDPDWTKTAHAQLDHGANNMTPLLGLYDILFQRRCGNILFTDRQIDGRTTDRWVSHFNSTGLWPIELKM